MKALLHFGMAKAGSNAIQSTLFRNRDALLRAGALYPPGIGLEDRHHHLFMAIHKRGSTNLPTTFRHRAEDELYDETEDFMRATAKLQSGKELSHTILSSETLFRPLDSEQVEKMRLQLKTVAQSVIPFAFVRELKHQFVSDLQQRVQNLKSINSLPSAHKVIDSVESYSRVGDSSPKLFLSYRGRSVIDDLSQFLMEHGLSVPLLQGGKENKSLSSGSAHYLLHIDTGKLQKPKNMERRQLIQILRSIDASHLMPGLRLLPEIESILESEDKVLGDYLWDFHALKFPNKTTIRKTSQINQPICCDLARHCILSTEELWLVAKEVNSRIS